mgnify:CR=1 FL=1
METQIPRAGKKYQLFDGPSSKDQSSFKGFYIGMNEAPTLWFMSRHYPEGHVFVRKDKENQIEIYCTGTEEVPKLGWFSDGDDGPSWPAGFGVNKVDVKLSKLEEAYLRGRLEIYELNSQGRLAA